MSMRQKAEAILSGFDTSGISELIREIEKETREPIQVSVELRVDTPNSAELSASYSDSIEQHFGSFEEREITLTRVECCDSKYEHDLELLEGKYASLRELQEKIEGYNAFYVQIGEPSALCEQAVGIIQQQFLTQERYTNIKSFYPLFVMP